MKCNSELLTIVQCTMLACLTEVAVPKPGNVHRSADFADTTFYDFQKSAVAICEAMENAVTVSVGETVLRAVQETQRLVGKNTNLGIILLFAPLARVPRDQELQTGVAKVLSNLTSEDCANFYRAISLANPGGLGKSDEFDIAESPPTSLIDAMKISQNRDRIAWQYTHDFEDIFEFVLPNLLKNLAEGHNEIDAIINVHLQTMAKFPDSLIGRKLGEGFARESSIRAQNIIDSGKTGSPEFQAAISDFDFWLRQDGNRRNPGTTADLIAAALFAGYRDNLFGKVE